MSRDDIARRAHALYWERNINCARVTLVCLSELFDVELHSQIWQAAVGICMGRGGFGRNAAW